MERNLDAGAAMEVEHADPLVFQQHREVVGGHLDRILRLDRARRRTAGPAVRLDYSPPVAGHVASSSLL